MDGPTASAWLPEVRVAGHTWRLPLVNRTAARLLDVSDVDDPVRRTALLAELVREDANLALWAACHSANRDTSRLTPAALGSCLADRLGVLIDAAATARSDSAGPAAVDPFNRAGRPSARQAQSDASDALEREKLESLKQLAYGASHEINNPLANIATRAQSLLQDETDPERRRKLAAINRQAFRATEMIADMMLFARPPKLALEEVRVAELLERLRAELGPLAELHGAQLLVQCADASLSLRADPVQLLVALRALCVNSLDALGRGGHLGVMAQVAEHETATGGSPARSVQFVVRDDGPGIAPEVRRHLFDPFFSGREAGRGLGFGLSKCWRIVTDHGGQIVVQSPTGGGATFALELPAAGPPDEDHHNPA